MADVKPEAPHGVLPNGRPVRPAEGPHNAGLDPFFSPAGTITAERMQAIEEAHARLAAWAKAAHRRLQNHAETMGRMDGAIEELFRRQHAEHAATVGRLMDFILRLAERCAGQAELLTKRAEK